MGCGCGEPVRQWQPARQAQQTAEQQEADESLNPNERIQQRLHGDAAPRVWPAQWNGREHTPAQGA